MMNCKICGKEDDKDCILWEIPEVGIICDKCLDRMGRIEQELKKSKLEPKCQPETCAGQCQGMNSRPECPHFSEE